MKILAIDTSGQVCSVALVDRGITLCELSINYKKTHSQTLMPMVESLLQAVETDLSSIDYIACASGPGSFTGLRIGAAAAKGLAHGAGKRIVQVPTLDALAYNIFSLDGIIAPMMDARRDQVYTAFYRWERERLVRLTDYMAEDIETVLGYAREYIGTKILTGDGVAAQMDRISAAGVDFFCPPGNMNRQRAASIGCLAEAMIGSGEETLDYKEFIPFYIRKPQAQREYERKYGHD